MVARTFLRVWLAPVLMLGLATAQAQDMTVPREYGKVIQSAEVVGSLGSDLFGDETNLYTGSTEFTVTDIDLPGSSAIPVRLGRRYVVEDKGSVVDKRASYPFGDWELDIPHLRGMFAKGQNWVGQSDGRCTNGGTMAEPPFVTVQGTTFAGSEYWYGNHLYAPGLGEQELLAYDPYENPHQPSTGGPYTWVTQGQWYFSCLPALAPQSGYTGEGFLAIDPEGNRYTFDWMVVYPAQTLKKQWNMPPILGMAPPPPATQVGGVVPRLPTFGFLEREEVWIYPSRIEDRFGNQVNFTWSGANLMQITASDGRAITLSYNSNGRVTSASNGSHTWTYGYDANNRYLFTAQRPGWLGLGVLDGRLALLASANPRERLV